MTFNLLTLDMSLDACSVALTKGKSISSITKFAARQQSRHILAMIQQLLSDEGLTFSHLNAVAFGCGPGSFTGVRLGASVAQGIAFTEDLAILPVSTLHAVAQAVCKKTDSEIIWVAFNAYSAEIYSAIYQKIDGGIVKCILPEHRCSPQKAILDATIIGDRSLAIVGDAWTMHADILFSQLPSETKIVDFYPYINEMASIAEYNFKSHDNISTMPENALPVYWQKDTMWKIS